MTHYGIRLPSGEVLPATHREQADRVARNHGGTVLLFVEVTTYEEGQAEISALRTLGPDVGEPDDAQSVAYIDTHLERLVMEVIARYPGSRIEHGKVHGLAASAAIQTVEKWLLDGAPAATENEHEQPLDE